MRTAFAALALLGAAAAQTINVTASNVYTTEVVTAFTTYCPFATTLSHNGQTYTVTSATTLTITNCPCTITKSSSIAPANITSSHATLPPSNSSSIASATPTHSIASGSPISSISKSAAPYPSINGTTTAPVGPTGTGSPATSSSVVPFHGAASKASAAGAAFLALFGLVAAL